MQRALNLLSSEYYIIFIVVLKPGNIRWKYRKCKYSWQILRL
jgi:hypothetical protein